MLDIIALIPLAALIAALLYMAWDSDRPLPPERKRIGAEAIGRILGNEVAA